MAAASPKLTKKALQCVLETAQGIIVTEMPSQVRPQSTLCMMRTEDIIKDIPHPGHHLFELQVNPHMHNRAGKKTLQILQHD